MRYLGLLAVLAAASSCFAPRPCTRSLCVQRLDGTMEVSGWSGTRKDVSDGPKPPVMSDSSVKMVFGRAEFLNGTTRVAAEEGSAFTFTVSTRALASISVTSGVVTVATSSGPAAAVAPGTSVVLPKAK